MTTEIINNISSDDASISNSTKHPAELLDFTARQQIAIEGLSGTKPISHLAQEHQVSRKFVSNQIDKAKDALEDKFSSKNSDDNILFYIPVTKAWLRTVVLTLVLRCHRTERGVIAFFADVLDESISIGSVHNIVNEAVITIQPTREYWVVYFWRVT
jgi:transcriptional antiterminator